MTFFFKAQILIGVLVHLFFVDTRTLARSLESEYIKKEIGNTEYSVRVSFSTFSPIKKNITTTQKNDIDILYSDSELYGPLSLICEDFEFECRSDHQCIPLEKYCDGKNDCADESDELMCCCADIEFECRSDHRCIPVEKYCDGKNDCADESDELTCASTPVIHFSIINDTEITTTTPTRIPSYNSIVIIIIILFLLLKTFKYFIHKKRKCICFNSK